MYYNAVITRWNNRYGFTATKDYTIKLLLRIWVRKAFVTILAWCRNHISRFENRLLRFSTSNVFKRFSGKGHMVSEGRFSRQLPERRRTEHIRYGWRKFTESALQWSHSDTTAYSLDNGLITYIQPNTSGRSFYIGVQSKERKQYFPSIPRSELPRPV